MSALDDLRAVLVDARDRDVKVRVVTRAGAEFRGSVASVDQFTLDLRGDRTTKVIDLEQIAAVEVYERPA